jgi:hypothetical protein
MIRHGIQCWTRASAVPLLRWDILGPFATLAWMPFWNDMSLWQVWSDEVIDGEDCIPAEQAKIHYAAGDATDNGGHRGCVDPESELCAWFYSIRNSK